MYSASHDMRTPLSGILGLSRLIRREIAGQDEALRYTDLIEESTNRMLGVLDTLSDYPLLRAKVTGPDSFDVEQSIKAIVERCKARYADTGVKFNSKITCKGSTEIPFKRKKMELLLRKLIENAFLFRNENAAFHNVEVTVMHSDASLRIDVADTGQGILPNSME